MELDRKIVTALENDLLDAWQAAHGVRSGKASALIGPDRLAILIDDAFSQAERVMSEAQTGETLMRQYALELLNQICDEKSLDVEQAVGTKIRSRDVNVNLNANQVMFIFTFEKEAYNA